MVEARTQILVGDGGAELDELGLVQMRPQDLHVRLIDLDRRLRHRIGIVQYRALQSRELFARLVIIELLNLDGGNAEPLYECRADIETEATADEGGDAELGELSQAHIDLVRPLHAELERDHRCQHRATTGVAVQRLYRTAELPPDHPEQESEYRVPRGGRDA